MTTTSVAITGANGFIGQHLVRKFSDAGWEVRPVVRRDFETGAIDQQVRGADVVVHAAGSTRAPSEAELRESIVGLTGRVLQAAQAGGAKRIVFISSQAAAGPASGLERPMTEETQPVPIEPYGRAKLDAEAIVRAQSDVPWVIVRPAAVYGPGDRDFLEMFRLARRGVAIHPANRDHWISIVHVSDLVSAILSAATAPGAVVRAYFVAADEPVQWGQLFALAAKCTGRDLQMDVNVPLFVAEVGAMLGDLAAKVTGHASLVTSHKLALSRSRFWVCSNARAKRELKFVPRIELQAGLRETYDWYVAQGWL